MTRAAVAWAWVAASAGFLAKVAAASDSEKSFLWGTATAAYQVEGYRDTDGRNKSIWDAFDTPQASPVVKANTPLGAARVDSRNSGYRADEDYVRYPDSVRLLQQLGFGAARLSVSWPRIMSFELHKGSGTKSGSGTSLASLRWHRNEKGIQHYHQVLNKYLEAQMEVALTMFHWDLPLAVEEYAASMDCKSAWLCHQWMPSLFKEYAQLLLTEYRHLVKWWITINEPMTVSFAGYARGHHAPGRCGNRANCWAGDSHTEPYLAMKGFLLAHAQAFRSWDQAGRPGNGCGIVLSGEYMLPFTHKSGDQMAAERGLEANIPVFADPIYKGVWPKTFVDAGGARAPRWTDEEIKLVNGTHDDHFFVNVYTTYWARPAKHPADCGYECDLKIECSGTNWTSGKTIGKASDNGWLYNYGPSLGKMISFLNRRYPGRTFVVTENGWGAHSRPHYWDDLLDFDRCNYFRDHIGNLSAIAAREGIKVGGYFAWSLLDNFEWADGYRTRFGLVYVDYHSQRRIPKLSAAWFKAHITHLTELPKDGKPLPPCEESLLKRNSAGIIHI